jgi:iron complex outermembrane recepter protein
VDAIAAQVMNGTECNLPITSSPRGRARYHQRMSVLAILLALSSASDAQDPARQLDRIDVVARTPTAAVERAEAVSRVDVDSIERIAAIHPSELLARLPGVWLSRGSGQESLLAIRSPVLAGPGACGAFLLLDDGIPLRPAGFCNVNQAFELDTEQAAAVELLRGPGTAVHGSNALHGAINARAPRPQDGALRRLRLEGGADALRRIRASGSDGERWRLDAYALDAGSFREAESVALQKLSAQWRWPEAFGTPRLRFAASDLDQQTAGYVLGEDAYRDARRRGNENPEAFRRARAARLHGEWQWQDGRGDRWRLVPYARQEQMRFIQHFAPGKPLEENGSDSAGVQLGWQREAGWTTRVGVDIEYASGELLQVQPLPLTTGAPALQATRPVGRHYDYRVDALNAALFAQWEIPLTARLLLQPGLRVEQQGYRYRTRMPAGNLREDGSACGFGGCLYQRPADRRDRYAEPAGQLGLLYAIDAEQQLVARLARAFRFPQATELYRLQRGQTVAELQPETLDGVELGWRRDAAGGFVAIDGYRYRKRHSILRDAEGLNVSDGASTHRGLELATGRQLATAWWLEGHASYAIHRYAFDRDIGAGERISRGNDVDTAPRRQAGLRLRRHDAAIGELELEGVHIGRYFTDAGNHARYPGHTLWHLRWRRELAGPWSLAARLSNLADRRYAERADFAFGNHRYFPGAGRSLFVELGYRAE